MWIKQRFDFFPLMIFTVKSASSREGVQWERGSQFFPVDLTILNEKKILFFFGFYDFTREKIGDSLLLRSDLLSTMETMEANYDDFGLEDFDLNFQIESWASAGDAGSGGFKQEKQ